jgi:peptidoglycan/LPS O-acetylase OafA/YrhL
LFLAAAVGSAWLRGQALADSRTNPLDLVRTQYAIDALFFGVFLSYLRTYHGLDCTLRRIPSWLLLLAGVMLAGWLPKAVYGPPAFQGVVTHVSGYLGAGLIVLAAYKVKSSTSKTLQFLAYLGSTSYSTYLWHGFVNILARKGPEWLFGFYNPWVYTIGYVGGAFAVGWLMYRLIEQPAMRLRDRWQPGRGSAGIAPQGVN